MLNYANNLHKQLGNGGNNKAYENLLWQQQEVEVAKMKPNQLLILALSLTPPPPNQGMLKCIPKSLFPLTLSHIVVVVVVVNNTLNH